MVLLFLFYISVCIMAIQVSTQSASRISQDYQERLKYAILSNDILLNANEKSIVELQRSVKELAERAVQDLDIPNETMTAYVECNGEAFRSSINDEVLQCMERKQRQLLDYYGQLNQNLLESWRRKFDELKRTTTGTQSNETEASCARLAPSNGYDFTRLLVKKYDLEFGIRYKNYYLFVKELLTDITNELTCNIRPGNTETH
uniref:Hypotheticial protein n=1 Tax=Schistosoma japonicum TaxID=6182 RepID=C7TXV1_SCHJA|nr:hypotheticial protein [Schistosoma japonicum]